jgi:hypothetical protein
MGALWSVSVIWRSEGERGEVEFHAGKVDKIWGRVVKLYVGVGSFNSSFAMDVAFSQ